LQRRPEIVRRGAWRKKGVTLEPKSFDDINAFVTLTEFCIIIE